MPVAEKQTYRFGPFELDPHCGQLRKDGIGLKLQGQPVQILEILLERPGQLVSRDEIRQRLWASDTFVDFDHSLNTAVKKLREALGDEAGRPQYIETLPKRGYRFVGDISAGNIEHEKSGGGALAIEDLSKVAAALADAAMPAQHESRNRVRRALWGVTVSLAVLITGNAVVRWLTKPLPVPHVVSSRALTRTGYRKAIRQARPVTDGVSVYFQESRPSGLATLQLSLGGGEPSEVAVSKLNYGSLRDISPDGSSLLLSALAPKTSQWDTWIQPLPTGPARLMVRDGRWPTWSPDGSSILFTRNTDRDLYRANAEGTDVRRLAGFPDITGLAISPDGKRIRFAVLPPGELWEAVADGTNSHRILPKLEGGIGSWSSDGRYYFFTLWGGDRSDLWALREPQHWWQTRPAPTRLTFGPMSIGEPTVTRDGRQLLAVAVERHGELSVYDRKSGQFVPYLGGIPACYVDFSKDGKWIAYVSYPEGSLWRSRIDGSERRQLTIPPFAVINPRWSPDGKLIVFTDYSNGDRRSLFLSPQKRIFVVSADGGTPMLLLAGNLGDPTWSPDGRFIAYDYNAAGMPEVRILDLQTQKSTTTPGSQGVWSPRWSPDGKHLAALGGTPPVRLGLFSFATKKWDMIPGGYYSWPAWSHDSKFVYALNQEGVSLVRFNIKDYRMEQIASLKGFPYTAYFWWNAGWVGLTPDDRPITTRDTGIEEVYAFDLDYE